MSPDVFAGGCGPWLLLLVVSAGLGIGLRAMLRVRLRRHHPQVHRDLGSPPPLLGATLAQRRALMAWLIDGGPRRLGDPAVRRLALSMLVALGAVPLGLVGFAACLAL